MRKLVLTIAVLALAGAGPAAASRHTAPSERKAIAASFSGYVHMPASPAAKDNRIVSLAVSTLDARYAAAQLNSKSAGPSEMVFHHSAFGWFVVAFGSSLGCDSAPKAVLADLKIGCTPPGSTAWISNCGPLVSTPRALVLTCADANYELAALRWHRWGGSTASATGAARVNDCTPYCAAGHFHSYRVTATADRLTRCGRARFYARVTVVYPGARPKGIAKRDVHTLSC
ncbi:MAG TPA: hypothetical protein VIJ70_09575 [Gaiellaceae bacterium]